MPIGPGGLDSNGIWQFGEDDSEALASDLLNLGMSSVSTAIGALPAPADPAILQVVSTTKTDTFSASVSGGGNVAVTGLSASITPGSTSSKIIVTAFFGQASNSKGNAAVGIAVNNGSGFVSVADAAGSRTRVTSAGQLSALEAQSALNYSMTVVDSPSTTSTMTYTVHAFNGHGDASNTIYINRDATDADNAFTTRSVSGITLMEVAG